MIDTVPTGRDKMIVLASNSPRRKELLRLISPGFEIEPAEIDERLDGNIPLDKMPEYLAVKKAEAVHKNHPGDIVIGCDTGVFINNMMIGKPGTDKTAFEILKLLSGKTHRVITGCAVFKGDEMISFSQVRLLNIITLESTVASWMSLPVYLARPVA